MKNTGEHDKRLHQPGTEVCKTRGDVDPARCMRATFSGSFRSTSWTTTAQRLRPASQHAQELWAYHLAMQILQRHSKEVQAIPSR